MPPSPNKNASDDIVFRRRRVFTILVAVSGVTLIFGLIPALRFILWLHLMADTVLAGFIALLIQNKDRSRTMPAQTSTVRQQISAENSLFNQARATPTLVRPVPGTRHTLLPEQDFSESVVIPRRAPSAEPRFFQQIFLEDEKEPYVSTG